MSVNIASWFIDRPARDNQARPALITDSRVLSYGELSDLTSRTAGALDRLRCSYGDRVLICLPDSEEFVATFFGAAKIGAIPVPVSSFASAVDYAYYLSNICPSVVVAHSSTLTNLSAALAKTSIETLIVGNSNEPQKGRLWEEYVGNTAPILESFQTSPNDPALIVHTSGSTGRQKAVVHSHNNMITAAQSVSPLFNIGAKDCIYSIAKLPFAFGLCFGMYLPLSAGASTVLNPARIELNDILKLIALHNPTILAAVPSILAALLQVHDSKSSYDLSSLRFVVCAGEPLPLKLSEEFKKRFGLELLNGLGSTEFLTHFITNSVQHSRAGTCGIEVPGCEVQLVGEDGKSVPDQEIGALLVRSNTAFAGYWNKPELTSSVRIGEWVITGDKLYRDADGYYHYCGRGDDMMKISGMWVVPQDIEAALSVHPAVDRVRVIPCEDRYGRKRLVAYLVIRPTYEVTDSELLRFSYEHLPEHMIPAALVRLSELPMTVNGKLKRDSLPLPPWSPPSSEFRAS